MPIYLQPYKKYFDFRGRASRCEYWGFYLFQVLVTFALLVTILMVGAGAGAIFALAHQGSVSSVSGAFGVLVTILGILAVTAFSLGSMIPNFSAMGRRLHDRGMSAWFLLVTLLPLFGALILLIVLALPGNVGDNQYGPDPKAFGE